MGGGGDAGDLTGANGLSSDPAVREVQVENRIRQAYNELPKRAQIWLWLDDLRAHPLLRDLDRADVDDALRRGAHSGMSLVPLDNTRELLRRPSAREAAIEFGAGPKHWVAWHEPAVAVGQPRIAPMLPLPAAPARKATPAKATGASAEWADWTPSQHRARALELQQSGDNAGARRHRSIAQSKARALADSGQAEAHVRGLDRDEARAFLRSLLRGQLDDVARRFGVSTEGSRDAVIARILAELFGG